MTAYPDLLQLWSWPARILDNLVWDVPESRPKCKTSLIQSQGMKGVLDVCIASMTHLIHVKDLNLRSVNLTL